MPRLSKIGAAALAAFGWTGLQTVSASYLVVAGGGGGGKRIAGGGGAGGLLTGTASLNPTLSYTVTVGAGGTGAPDWNTAGTNGSNSVFNTATSIGGGGGSGSGIANGVNGGSGGGSSNGGTAGTGTSGQGNNGGVGSGTAPSYGGGGGGGASAVGGNGTSTVAGNGGAGTASSISGSSVTYAGGGGGGSNGGTAGTGGSGGGGAGTTSDSTATAGTANLGGGGGGCGGLSTSSGTTFGGAGGSGIVIISYTGAQQFGGGIVTSSGGNTIHTFTTSGTLSPLSQLTASYLIVAGGGGGGNNHGGGGGAGGYQTSSLTLDTNSIYTVTIGAGGASASKGSNSSFISVTSVAGGKGTTGGDGSTTTDSNGGSGGGGNGFNALPGGTGTTGQGNNGGNGTSVASNYAGGGGGGASAAGAASGDGVGGNGGAGSASSISGSSVTYAGGGGGGVRFSGTAGSGGSGGGGAGGVQSVNGTAGSANTGGGGGAGGGSGATGGAGGSGVVIISYPGSTPQMAGGTVTAAGGNIIHTFTSSGYLTPITNLNNSLRFRSSASAYLNRTMTTATNNLKWTWSAWVKRGTLGTTNIVFNAGDGSSNNFGSMQFTTGDVIQFAQINGGTYNVQVTTNAVFRDPSAWYHVVLVYDSANATSTDRVQIYVNGTRQSVTYITGPFAQNTSSKINSALAHYISKLDYASLYFDGYMAEINFIDGQALTPSSFGAFNGQGVWQPVRYGGSYGTNGFYLPFTNTTSTTTLGYDFSPNGNNWATNNISLTAGSTYDSMRDVPTLTSATAANYCVFNPLDRGSTNFTLSNGNLNIVGASASSAVRATMAVSSGKWYWEAIPTAIGNGLGVGFAGDSSRFNPATWNAGTYVIYQSDGNKHINGSASSYGATYTTNDVIGVALDMDAGTITFYKNNVSQGTASTGLTGIYLPVFSQTSGATTGTINANFGAGSGFAYTPPTGFVALNTFNLPTPTIGTTASTQANKYFDVTTYAGTGAIQTITNSGGFQPDLIWGKQRDGVASWHIIVDAVRGVKKVLASNNTNAEWTEPANSQVDSITSTGFTLGANNSSVGGNMNASGTANVAWQWRASNTTAVTNTAGSITSTVSANTTAGFSIVTYTGTGANATVGHGLGVAPSMIIVKNRTTAGTSWAVYTSTTGATNYLRLNSTIASTAGSSFWNNTAPTSTVFSIGTDSDVNANTNNIVAYCFAQIAGYSAFGSYTGNGSSDGPFIYTGFRPRYYILKNITNAQSWSVQDTSRSPYNVGSVVLLPNSSSAELTGTDFVDILSNGFKIRHTGASGNNNNSGDTYIYMAFAESPFKYANAR